MNIEPETFLQSDPAPSRYKRIWKILLYFVKFGISIFILWMIARKISFASALADILKFSPLLIMALIGISIVRNWLQYRNWLCALKINPGYEPDHREVLKSYLIGLPLRFAIPGGHASIAKIFYISNSSRSASFWSTMLERSFLTWATWTFASGAAVVYFTDFPLVWLLIAMALCIMAPEILYLTLGLKDKWRPLQKTYSRQGAWMILIQIASTLLTYLQYWLLLRCFIPLSFMESSLRMALVQFSNSIPITISGLGLRESFAIHFLKDTGITAEQAVSATLCLFIIQDVLPAMVGLWFLVKAKPAGEMKHAMKHPMKHSMKPESGAK